MLGMTRRGLLVALLTLAGVVMGARLDAAGHERISGPYTHENLSVYFIHGRSAPGPVPLTLEEALAKGSVRVNETGDVNRLTMDNLGTEAVFVQAGTIVKGGKQDRVLVSSLLVPARAQKISMDAYCVEQNRWSARGQEESDRFATAQSLVPSRAAKGVLLAPDAAQSGMNEGESYGGVYERQNEMWRDVARIQQSLSTYVGGAVASPQSQSSLQLALENESLNEIRTAYRTALSAHGESGDDITGYAFAINGTINSVDLYPSNELFRKMWAALLTASITEAIAERQAGPVAAAPVATQIDAFIAAGQAAAPTVRTLDGDARIVTRRASKVLSFEAAPSPAAPWVHRSLIAR